MTHRYLNLALLFVIFITYNLLYFVILAPSQIQDFTSFYAAILNWVQFKNPYTTLDSNFLELTKKLSANLNPPFVFFVFSFLAKFSYQTALEIWLFLSFILGLIGAGLSIYYAFADDLLRRNWLILLLIYLAFFSTLINFSTAQIGLILLFLVMIGYHYFLKNCDLLAGFFWGLLVAFKFFPALLFIFLLKVRRIKLFVIMLITTVIACLLPFLHDPEIYSQYFAMMAKVSWYGDNWNASIFGFISRLFGPIHPIIYAVLFVIGFFWYLKKLGMKAPFIRLRKNRSPTKFRSCCAKTQPTLFLKDLETEASKINHHPFCLSLTMMLMLSPFGWIYYFPLLIFPLFLIWAAAYEKLTQTIKPMLIFLIAFFFINMPQGYVYFDNMTLLAAKTLFYSWFFYGLLLINYLCGQEKILLGKNQLRYDENKQIFITISLFILSFSLVVTALRLVFEFH